MNNKDFAVKRISDFIYKKPQIVVAILKESGYDISLDTATLRQINELTFNALYDGDVNFTTKLEKVMQTNEYLYIAPLVGIGISALTSLFGGFTAQEEAKKQRELQKAMFLADLSSKEMLEAEKNKLTGEIERTKILANSIGDYRIALQKESTKRIRDTWITVAMYGLTASFLYGTYLMFSKD